MGCIALEYSTVEEIENNINTDKELREDIYTVYDEFSDTTLNEIIWNSKNTHFTDKYPGVTFIIRDLLHKRGMNPYPESIDKNNNFVGINET